MPQENFTTNKVSKRFLKRRLARIRAVQCLYSIFVDEGYDGINESILNIINIYKTPEFESKFTASDEKYLVGIAKGTYENSVELQDLIQLHLADDWKFSRLGKVIQSILCVATYEILNAGIIDQAVIINEYLEIAKDLNHDGETGFINSILDRISKNKLTLPLPSNK